MLGENPVRLCSFSPLILEQWGEDSPRCRVRVGAWVAGASQACVPVRDAPVFDNGTYYRAAYQAETPSELRAALATAISTGYQRYSYACVWDIAGDADQDPRNPDNVILFYTGQSWPKLRRRCA